MLFFASALHADGVPAELRERLDRAGENLLLAEATERRIERSLEALRTDPGADPASVAAMERYLESVRQIRRTHADALRDLQLLAEQGGDGLDPVVAEGLRAFEASLAALPKAEEPVDEIARLDAEFAASLDRFDRMIDDHLAKVRGAMDARLAAASTAATGPAQAAAEAAALLRRMGVDPGTGHPTASGTAKEESSGSTVATTRPSVVGTSGGSATSAGAGGSERPARQDEDIVARQLREAAEKETDPVLREKLWKEYEVYIESRS